MRKQFAQLLLDHAREDKDIILVTGDLGYGMWDQFRKELPDQFYNVGAAEQAMMGIGVGLAMAGKKPFVYSITPFLLYRPFETIRNYIDHEKIPVRLVGSGRDRDYAHDGFSHHATDDRLVMDLFENIECFWPNHEDGLELIVDYMIMKRKPSYINLSR